MTGDRRALLIDYGGVLTCPVRQAHRTWAVEEGVAPTALDDVLRAWAGTENPVHLVETGHLAAADFERELAARLTAHVGRPVAATGLLARIFAHLIPVPAMISLVRRVHEAGVRTVLVTNSWGSGSPWDTPGAFTGILDAAVVSHDIGARKPDPCVYTIAAEYAEVPPNRCVFVDDLVPNVTAAAALGMYAVRHRSASATIHLLGAHFGLDPMARQDNAEQDNAETEAPL